MNNTSLHKYQEYIPNPFQNCYLTGVFTKLLIGRSQISGSICVFSFENCMSFLLKTEARRKNFFFCDICLFLNTVRVLLLLKIRCAPFGYTSNERF